MAARTFLTQLWKTSFANVVASLRERCSVTRSAGGSHDCDRCWPSPDAETSRAKLSRATEIFCAEESYCDSAVAQTSISASPSPSVSMISLMNILSGKYRPAPLGRLRAGCHLLRKDCASPAVIRQLVLPFPHDQHRAWRMANHTLGGAAHECMLESGITVGAQDLS